MVEAAGVLPGGNGAGGTGGAGGAAVDAGSYTFSVTNNGTIYGST